MSNLEKIYIDEFGAGGHLELQKMTKVRKGKKAKVVVSKFLNGCMSHPSIRLYK